MGTEAEELLQFLTLDSRSDVRRVALDALLGMSSAESSVPILLHSQCGVPVALTKLLAELPWSADAKAAGLTLINALSFPPVRQAFAKQGSAVRSLVSCERDGETGRAPLAAKALSNLSVDVTEAVIVLDALPDQGEFVRQATTALTALAPDADGEKAAGVVYAGYVLRNLSQLASVRAELARDALFARLLPLAGLPGPQKRKLLALHLLRNLACDSSLRGTLLEGEEFLVALLLPLTGPEELSEEENDALPLDLQYMGEDKVREPEPHLRLLILEALYQYMGEDKVREPEPHLRILILEALYQICSTKEGREYLRGKGVYYILRGYDKWEPDSTNKELGLSVIGLLIRTEDEIVEGELKSIPDHLTMPAGSQPSAVIRTSDISDKGLVRL